VSETQDIKDPRFFIMYPWSPSRLGRIGGPRVVVPAYGPDEAFRALAATRISRLLVLMTAVTIFVISIAYST